MLLVESAGFTRSTGTTSATAGAGRFDDTSTPMPAPKPIANPASAKYIRLRERVSSGAVVGICHTEPCAAATGGGGNPRAVEAAVARGSPLTARNQRT